MRTSRLLLAGALCLHLLHVCPPARADAARPTVIEVTATTAAVSPVVTLNWPVIPSATSLTLYRRAKGATSWTSAALAANATSYADTAAAAGVCYEYSLQSAGSVRYGSIVAGHNLPLVETRGKVIVLVDATLSAPLAPEFDQLRRDLVADGWTVYWHDVARSTVAASSTAAGAGAARLAELQATKALIQADYATAPGTDWALLLIGRIPVPYSGYIYPDGHTDHLGAWPTDTYYGDMDGSWTDTSINAATASDQRNRNTPGDGKFDQSTVGGMELQVGRVDLSSMNSVPTGMGSVAQEIHLTRQYLVRDHRFRRGLAPYDNVARRGFVCDAMQSDVFAASGWRNSISMFGRNAGQTDAAVWFDTLPSTSALFAYGCGYGGYARANGVGQSADDFGIKNSKAVFTLLFGSYFGDWDYPDSFLRAPLAGTADSLGLASAWSGRGYVHLHHMAMGETLGYGMRFTQNNAGMAGDWYQNGYNKYVSTNLMGDPTLRLHTVRPPARVRAVSTASGVALDWLPSADAVAGYHIYRGASENGPFTRLTGVAASAAEPLGQPLSVTSYLDATAVAGATYVYLVKAAKLETSASGAYANQSLGETVAVGHQIASAPPAAPTRLVVAAVAAGSYSLSWDDNASDETAYEVERRDPDTGAWSLVATLGAGSTAYVDAAATAGKIAQYRVRATGPGGASAYSNLGADYALPGIASFLAPSVSLQKGAAATLTVRRLNGAQGGVSAGYATTPLLAAAGTDYLATSGTVSWPHADAAAKPVPLTLLAPEGPQLTKLLRLDLLSPSGGLLLGNPASLFVHIADPASQTLPSPWSTSTLGTIVTSGYAEHKDGVFGLFARTAAVSHAIDSFRMASRTLSGDSQFTARLVWLSTPVASTATAGVMLRSATAGTPATAAMIMAMMEGTTAKRYHRTANGGSFANNANVNSLSLPRWLRAVKSGTTFTVYQSADGVSWTNVGASITLGDFASTYYAALVVASNTAEGEDRPAYARFDNVTLYTALAAPVVAASPGAQPGEIQLAWPAVAGAESYVIERSATAGSGYAQLSATTSTAFTDAALPAGQTFYYRVKAKNPAYESAYSAEASALPALPATLAGWRYQQFGANPPASAADAADPDGDGLPNLLEYALGTAPLSASSGPSALPLVTLSSGKLSLTFTRRHADLVYAVLASGDLKTWTTLATNPGVVGEPVTVQDDDTVSTSRYLRLQVSAGASVAATVPEGRLALALAQNQETAVAFPLHLAPVAITGSVSGVITAVGPSTLENIQAGWSPGALSGAAAPYLARLTSGVAAGCLFPVSTSTANTATTITLVTGGLDLTTLGIQPGLDTCELVPADTLGSLLPAGALQSGTPDTADLFRLWNGTAWVSFYHDGSVWRRVGAGSADNLLLRPDQGYLILRRGPAVSLTLFGRVPSAPARILLQGGRANFIAGLPVAATFLETVLQSLPGWTTDLADPKNGDHVQLWNGTAWFSYYHDGAGWRRVGAGPADSAQLLRPGRPLMIVRSAAAAPVFFLHSKTY